MSVCFYTHTHTHTHTCMSVCCLGGERSDFERVEVGAAMNETKKLASFEGCCCCSLFNSSAASCCRRSSCCCRLKKSCCCSASLTAAANASLRPRCCYSAPATASSRAPATMLAYADVCSRMLTYAHVFKSSCHCLFKGCCYFHFKTFVFGAPVLSTYA